MAYGVGSYEWARNGGALNLKDRVQLTGQVLVTRLGRMSATLRSQIGLSDPMLSHLDANKIVPPDSAMARHSFDKARTDCSAWVLNHCLRTYVWGELLGQARKQRPDRELLYVASMLHDLRLSHPVPTDAGEKHCHCFAVSGAIEAERFVLANGWSQDQARRVFEAISLHLNVRVGVGNGVEAHLLNAGAGMDLVGAGHGSFTPSLIAAVLQRHPRLDFAKEMVAAMKEQARANPASRSAFLLSLGVAGMIRKSGLDAH